ncbi:MAG: cache domain-containing protein [bacterium]
MKTTTLKTKLITFIVLLTSFALVISGVLLTYISRNAVKETILRESANIATEVAGEIELKMESALGILNAYSELITINKLDKWRCTVLLANLTKNFEQFQNIYILDKEGGLINTSNIETPLSNLANEPAFQNALCGETYLSEVYITSQMLPAVKMSTPIKRLGQIDGVLIIELNLKWIWNLVDKIDIGRTGFAYVFSKSGLLITHPNKIWVLEKKNLNNLSIVKKALSNQKDAMIFINAEERKVIGACAPITKLGWGVVIEQDVREAFAYEKRMLNFSILLIILSVITSCLLGSFKAMHIVKPIEKLTKGTQIISEGNLDHWIEITSNDEIGRLTNSFNKMVTQIKEQQEKIREGERLSALGMLASAIAHEIKNPLQSISLLTDILPGRLEDKEFVQKYTTLVPKELDRLNDFLKELLNLSRPIQRNAMCKTDIHQILQEVVYLLEGEARDKLTTITIVTSLGDKNRFIFCQPDQVFQAIINIVKNAISAIRDKGNVTIKTSGLENNDQYLKIEVEDTGQGITPSIMKDIFKPFFTSKAGGTGLGLAITKKIIEEHLGKIEVTSQVGKGTIFIIILPTAIE